MQALWLENYHLELRELPVPANPGEALNRVRLLVFAAHTRNWDGVLATRHVESLKAL